MGRAPERRVREIPFATSAPTLGVEWEFALVDRETGDLSNTAAELFERVDTDRVHKELLRNTVELVTGVCDNTAGAMADLRQTLDLVRPEAHALGVDLFGAGTHPFAHWDTQQLTESPRYAELIERTQWWGRQMLIWGVHVHVGVGHRDRVLPIVTALLADYPHLLALSAASPMWAGTDTGYASNRAMMFQQLPTAGLPFQFSSWAEYETFVDDQMVTGIIDEINEIRWDIRPAPALGTVEVRICDATSNMRELAGIVALTHCLVVDLDRRLAAGERPDEIPPWLVQENKWRAARYGLDAEIIVDSRRTERLVGDDLIDKVEQLLPVARDLDCVAELESVLDIPRRGASYQRQRAVYAETGSMREVVRSIVAELDG